MNLAFLILAAVAIPLTVLALLWLILTAGGWMAARPRANAILSFVLGAAYVAAFSATLAEDGMRLSFGAVVQGVAAVLALMLGGFHLHQARRSGGTA